MAVRTQILNGTNLNRDEGFSSLVSSYLKEGVRGGFGGDLAVTANQVANGMAFIEITRTTVTPNEVFLVPVWVDVATAVDTSGDGYIVIKLDQTKINDGSANSGDGTGIATVEKVAVLPSGNYIQLASLAGGVITDTRVSLSIDIAKVQSDQILADEILEKTLDNGVLIDGILSKDGFFDFAERGSNPATPASTHWRLFFKSDGLYQIDDAGVASKFSSGGATTNQIAEGSALNGELFENTNKGNNLSWKNSRSEVYELGDSFQLGENMVAGNAVCLLGSKAYGGADIECVSGEDTYVDVVNGAVNYVTATSIYARGTGTSNQRYAFIKPNLSAITDLHRLISFSIVLNQTASGGAGTLNALPITSSCIFGTVTYNTQPTYGSTMGSTSAGVGTKTINCTVPDSKISNNIIANGISITNSADNLQTFESADNVGTAPPKITNIVYISKDGKIRKTNASIPETVGSFIGFIQEAGNADDWRPVTRRGVIDIAGVATGDSLWLTNVAGGIGTVEGTYGRRVGLGVGTTRMDIVTDAPNIQKGGQYFSPTGTGTDLVFAHNLGRRPRKVTIHWGSATSTNTFSYLYSGTVVATDDGAQSDIQNTSPSAGNGAWGSGFTPDGATGAGGWTGAVSFDDKNITIDVTAYTATNPIQFVWVAE